MLATVFLFEICIQIYQGTHNMPSVEETSKECSIFSPQHTLVTPSNDHRYVEVWSGCVLATF